MKKRIRIKLWMAALCAALMWGIQNVAAQDAATVGGIEVTADQIEYRANEKLLIGRGNVLIRYGSDELKADFVSVRTDTQDAYAKGNVLFRRGDQVWQGDEIRYNFLKKEGDFGQFRAFVDPYYVSADDSRRLPGDRFVLKDVTITTCDGPNPEYHLRAAEARIEQGEHLHAKHVRLYLGPIPILYVPYWRRQIAGDKTDIDLMPGYSSRMGPYLLTAYNYRLNDVWKASTRLDWRAKRGLGVGQDFEWGDSPLDFYGFLRTYYIHDRSPLEKRDEDEIKAYGEDVSNDRYRIRLYDRHWLSDRDVFSLELHYLSDPLIIEDFFNREFRNQRQPENRASLVHRGDQFSAGLQINQRLNDFFENVNRAPEAFLTVPRMQLGGSPFYYESQNSAARLERVFPERSDREDYDAIRLDTAHTVYYPTRHWGFLNVIPRAGFRGTYYSTTYEEHVATNVISEVGTNGEVRITNEVVRWQKDVGSTLRGVPELGVELSFKAFGTFHNDPIVTGSHDVGLRHVAEPYARHTFIPEPNVRPHELPQFDSIDRIDKQHDIRFGLRNKLQTKRRQRVHDLVDADVWTTYLIEKGDEDRDFGDIGFDINSAVLEWLRVDADGAWDPYESNLVTFNTQLGLLWPDESRVNLEYRYQRDRREQIAGEITLFPEAKWSFTAYARYSVQDSQLEEHSYFVRKRWRCLGTGLGLRMLEDDVQVWFQVWILAFPNSTLDLSL